MSQPKSTTVPSMTQEVDQSLGPRGLIATIPCIRGLDSSTQLLECPTKVLAAEVLEMLRPVFPNAQLYCFEVAVTDSIDACRRRMERHTDLILSCREADHPGRVYLERVYMTRKENGAYARGGAQ